MKRLLNIMILTLPLLLIACGSAQEPAVGLPNPASVYCEEQGGTLELRTEVGGQVGICHFDDGSECEEWAFYRDECAPGDSNTVSWEEALAVLNSGAVVEVFQAHSLDVTLKLADGRTLYTVEPQIDAVFTAVDACGAPCADILLATE